MERRFRVRMEELLNEKEKGTAWNATKISHNAFGYTGLWVGTEKRRKFGA